MEPPQKSSDAGAKILSFFLMCPEYIALSSHQKARRFGSRLSSSKALAGKPHAQHRPEQAQVDSGSKSSARTATLSSLGTEIAASVKRTTMDRVATFIGRLRQLSHEKAIARPARPSLNAHG